MIFFALLMFPLIEISLALAVIKEFGFPNAFFAWLLATVLGFGLVRTSGLRLTVGVAQAMREGKAPGVAALDGALIGLAGVLFLIPGYFSDVLAILLLIPPLRKYAAKRLVGAISVRTGSPQRHAANRPGPSSEDDDAAHAVIDVDAVVIEPERISEKE